MCMYVCARKGFHMHPQLKVYCPLSTLSSIYTQMHTHKRIHTHTCICMYTNTVHFHFVCIFRFSFSLSITISIWHSLAAIAMATDLWAFLAIRMCCTPMLTYMDIHVFVYICISIYMYVCTFDCVRCRHWYCCRCKVIRFVTLNANAGLFCVRPAVRSSASIYVCAGAGVNVHLHLSPTCTNAWHKHLRKYTQSFGLNENASNKRFVVSFLFAFLLFVDFCFHLNTVLFWLLSVL